MNQDQAAKYREVILKLNERFKPHPGQIKVGKALFDQDTRHIFMQCGRNWGKTELVAYILWRWAALNPKSSCYYISPFQKQSREIIWASKRIQNMGPREWLLEGSHGINNSEMRLNFTNGSFIKCDGSDNYDAYRGVKPHIVCYEEFKDFRPEWHVAMDPNLAAFNAPLLIIGTPPETENQFTSLAEEYRRTKGKAFYTGPSWENTYLDREWLSKKKQELYARGEGDVWEREYGGRFIRGGASTVFPMLNKATHQLPHGALMDRISRDRPKLEWFCIADPGTTTCFAVLFMAVNPFKKEVYFLDEIYETSQKNTSVNEIGPRILQIEDELWEKDQFRHVYDEAASWFANEALDRFGVFWEPTKKATNNKEHGLSLIKDALLQGRAYFSTNCQKLWWEMQNYAKDSSGKVPKKNDHLIDCARYGLTAAGFGLNMEDEPPMRDKDEMPRAYSLQKDIDADMGKDWDIISSDDYGL